MITIFTAPKGFKGHIGIIQTNAIRSWKALGDEVEVLLIGDEEGMAAAAKSLDVGHLAAVERNASGTPLLSSIFGLAHSHGGGETLCYVNADILLTPDLLEATVCVQADLDEFLIVGSRMDVRVEREIGADEFQGGELFAELMGSARRHPPAGSDYFIFSRDTFQEIPSFALGRSGWDNWMIYAARRGRLPVVDASRSVVVFHQDHDYAHLPGGQSHYRLPESLENVALAGGREMMFTLQDATWELESGMLRPRPIWAPSLFRRLETAAYCSLGPGRASRLFRLLFHPVETARYLWQQARGARAGANNSGDDNGMLESGIPKRSNSSEV